MTKKRKPGKRVEKRFVELGRAGANADVNHPGRKEWEALRERLCAPKSNLPNPWFEIGSKPR